MAGSRITRVVRDTRRRRLLVTSVEPLGNAMWRAWLTGDDLADFESDAPDDHVKLFLPEPDPEQESAARDYTPRLFDPGSRTLAIDFALHGSPDTAGPATRWAMTARPGDEIEVGGPRGSTVVTDDFDWYLLVGDTTAFPAIARRLEELRPAAVVHVMLLVSSGVDLPPLARRGATTVERIATDELTTKIAAWQAPEGDGFVWIAAEADTARVAREAVLARGWPREWLKASGYWRAGAAGAHMRLGE